MYTILVADLISDVVKVAEELAEEVNEEEMYAKMMHAAEVQYKKKQKEKVSEKKQKMCERTGAQFRERHPRSVVAVLIEVEKQSKDLVVEVQNPFKDLCRIRNWDRT